jgi:hypothetical protein
MGGSGQDDHAVVRLGAVLVFGRKPVARQVDVLLP